MNWSSMLPNYTLDLLELQTLALLTSGLHETLPAIRLEPSERLPYLIELLHQ